MAVIDDFTQLNLIFAALAIVYLSEKCKHTESIKMVGLFHSPIKYNYLARWSGPLSVDDGTMYGDPIKANY